MKAAAQALAAAAVLAAGTPLSAQTASTPGPWVIDVRGVTSPVPDDSVYYPPLDRSAIIPERGFGLDVGAHVYIFNLGPSRVGIGGNFVAIRSITKPAAPATTTTTTTTTDTTAQAAVGQSLQVDLRSIASQVSFNFGSREGWSYLSGGAGFTGVGTLTAGIGAAERDSGRVIALNVGGGARWFLRSHFAFGFDIRMYRLGPGTAGRVEESAPPAPTGTPFNGTTDPSPTVEPTSTPGKTIVVVGVGLSFK